MRNARHDVKIVLGDFNAKVGEGERSKNLAFTATSPTTYRGWLTLP